STSVEARKYRSAFSRDASIPRYVDCWRDIPRNIPAPSRHQAVKQRVELRERGEGQDENELDSEYGRCGHVSDCGCGCAVDEGHGEAVEDRRDAHDVRRLCGVGESWRGLPADE